MIHCPRFAKEVSHLNWIERRMIFLFIDTERATWAARFEGSREHDGPTQVT